MSVNSQPGYKIRLFVGCIKNSEVQMHLKQSKSWNDDLMLGQQQLQIVFFKEEEYIGLPHSNSSISEQELKELEKKSYNLLKIYCPNLNRDRINFVIIPELLVG